MTAIYKTDSLARVIHGNYRLLVVLDRVNISLGFANQTIEEIAQKQQVNPDALVLILNLFANENFISEIGNHFDYLPDIILFLRKSHTYFLEDKIPSLQKDIQELVQILQDPKSNLVERFYNKYSEEISEHMEYENDTVFPYIESLYAFHSTKKDPTKSKSFSIQEYKEHHDDIEATLNDLKNILIRHLPQKEDKKLRFHILKQLFELETDLCIHTKIENEVIIPLVRNLESHIQAT